MFKKLVMASLLAFIPLQANAMQIAVCVLTQGETNPTYYGLAVTATELQCENIGPNPVTTLNGMYEQGWRMIQVIGGDGSIDRKGNGQSPLYYFER